jgi:hypothetical protein
MAAKTACRLFMGVEIDRIEGEVWNVCRLSA